MLYLDFTVRNTRHWQLTTCLISLLKFVFFLFTIREILLAVRRINADAKQFANVHIYNEITKYWLEINKSLPLFVNELSTYTQCKVSFITSPVFQNIFHQCVIISNWIPVWSLNNHLAVLFLNVDYSYHKSIIKLDLFSFS